MRLSSNGRALIQGFEGYSSKAYRDADGWSIGYGHFMGKDPSLSSRTVTREQADRLFDGDVSKFELAVSTTTPEAAQHEFDAMVSLAYNIGTAGFAGSSVAKRHNAGDREGAADAFLMWNKSQGKVLPVLEKRRARERQVYLFGFTAPGSFPTPPSYEEPIAEVTSSSPTWPPPPAMPANLEPPAWRVPEAAPSWHLTAPSRVAPAVTLAALGLGWLLYRLIHR